jgi:vitamin-K-epoxide reductase (warfarin-sensitive)
LSYFGLVPHDSLLDLPNAALGILYYSWILLFIDMPISLLQRLLNPMIASAAMASSLFLAYQLTFVLKELCVLCWTTHVINTLLFYNVVLRPNDKNVGGKRKYQ